jgi:hypothetical protein
LLFASSLVQWLCLFACSKAMMRLASIRTRDSVSWRETLSQVQHASSRDQNVLEHSPAQSK